jgi:hypothetical protein
MYVEVDKEKPCIRSIRSLNLAMARPTTFQVTSCSFGVVKYCDIFVESRGVLLCNSTINSDVTMEHVTLRHVINGSIAENSIFYVVRGDIYITLQQRDCRKRCSPWVHAETLSGESKEN